MILNERDIRNEQVLRIGMQMMTAARTAPKGKGVDVIEVAMLTGEDIKRLSDMMIAMYGEHGMKFFLRDAINTVDVGIAIGSACATAADHRVDTRVMFSAGLAAQRMNLLKDCKQVFAIPVSASSKNPFFDRKPKEQQP